MTPRDSRSTTQTSTTLARCELDSVVWDNEVVTNRGRSNRVGEIDDLH